LAAHIRDSIEHRAEENERDFSDFLDHVQKRKFNSFFDQNLGLFSKWF